MAPKRPHPDSPRVLPWVVGNLFPVLLFCTIYFTLFAALWGPPRPWKWLLALSLVVALCLGVDTTSGRSARRRGTPSGSRAAQARARWPAWRLAGSASAGLILIGCGVYQALGIEVNVGNHPVLYGLCFVVSVGIGVPLIALTWPHERWRRAPTPRDAPQRPREVGAFLPGERDEGPGTTLKLPKPGTDGYAGVWGGFGSKPAYKAWQPRSSPAAGTGEPVPERFRRLRLRRRPGLRRTSAGSPLLSILVGVLALVGAALITYGCAVT